MLRFVGRLAAAFACLATAACGGGSSPSGGSNVPAGFFPVDELTHLLLRTERIRAGATVAGTRPTMVITPDGGNLILSGTTNLIVIPTP